jgi:FdhD protein
MSEPSKSFTFYRMQNGQIVEETGHVITEMAVSLTVNGEIWLTFMCTPVDLEALAVGFLFNEGLIQEREQIADVRVCATGDNIDVWTTESIRRPRQWRKTSGCTGGVTSVESERPNEVGVVNKNGGILSSDEIAELVDDLFTTQKLYRLTGGVHTSTLTDGKGHFVTAEDIGRHNTLDKIAGKCLLENIRLTRRILLTTGRISSEMLQKAARIKAAVLISRTSPSTLSIDLAEQTGITLIGYARRNQFTIYTHPERIVSSNLLVEIQPTSSLSNP